MFTEGGAADTSAPDEGRNAGQADSGDIDDGGGADAEAADAGAVADGGGPDAALRVLFIGNSYTYVNDLPGMLARIAATSGTSPAIVTDEVVQGGATLHNHVDNGIAAARINEQRWSHVVLQGQSMEALYPGNDNFKAAALTLGNLAIDSGARPALFVTWARAAGDPMYGPLGVAFNPEEMQDLITRGYDDVAGRLPGSVLSCVGEAFRRSLFENPAIALHQSDNSHPTVAGTYLAACTFYVALTGSPVPPTSEVPPEVGAGDAEALRKVALVGSDCAEARLKGVLSWGDCSDTACRVLDLDPAGIPVPCRPRPCNFDFGPAGTPIPQTFIVRNAHYGIAGVADGLTLEPPFAWTSGSYPGGSGTAIDSFGTPYDFCSSSLPPQTSCAVSVTYSAAIDGSGTLTIVPSSAYDMSDLARHLNGSRIARALLTIGEYPGFFGHTHSDETVITAAVGSSTSLNLVVSNRGGAPVTSLAVGTPLSAPFHWGPTGTDGVFPGGSGTGTVYGVTYDYCAAQTLAAGDQCILTVLFSPSEDGTYESAIDLQYADAEGPVAPDASRRIRGTITTPVGTTISDAACRRRPATTAQSLTIAPAE